MEDRIEIDPAYPLSRFSILPKSWTGFTSAAALCLVLPVYFRRRFPARARAVLLAGLDRYAACYGEGDVAELVARAETYLAGNLDAERGHTLAQLREMLRLHAGRLLEGRTREALTAAVYLAAHVLSACGAPGDITPAELWVLNEATLDAKPISSHYATLDGASPDEALLDPRMTPPKLWGASAYVRVPVGSRAVLFQWSTLDALLYRNLKAHGYGLSPSWALRASRGRDGGWAIPFGRAVEHLTTRVFPALTALRGSSPRDFERLPDVFVEVLTNRAAASAPADYARGLMMSIGLEDPTVGMRVLEFILGELRGLDLEARRRVHERACRLMAAAPEMPAVPMYATLTRSVLGLGARVVDYERRYFMPA